MTPAQGCAVVGYVFAAGAVRRWKTYSWLPVHPQPAAAAGDPDAGWSVYHRFAADVPPHRRTHAVFLQLPVYGRAAADSKLFFFSGAVGPDDMVRVLRHVTTALRSTWHR